MCSAFLLSVSLRFCCKITRNTFQYFSETSQFWLMNYSLSARIYPIVDFEVVGTLICNGLSGFALKKFSLKLAFIDLLKQKSEF